LPSLSLLTLEGLLACRLLFIGLSFLTSPHLTSRRLASSSAIMDSAKLAKMQASVRIGEFL
jgi:hypothetical protein